MARDFRLDPLANLEASDLPHVAYKAFLYPYLKYITYYPENLLLCVKHVKNSHEAVLGLFGARKSTTLVFNDGSSYEIGKGNFRNELRSLLLMKERGQSVRTNRAFTSARFTFMGREMGLEGPDAPWLAREMFISEEYGQADVKGKDVLDIGASIGDSAIYFAAKGARRVVALEPYPRTFALAKKNVAKNGFSKAVRLLNAGAGAKDGWACLEDDGTSKVVSQLGSGKTGKRVRILSLASIVEKEKIRFGSVLKIDCEGDEYGVLLSAPDSALSRFGQVVLEYHYGQANLKRRLKSAGFEIVQDRRIGYYFQKGWHYPHSRSGILFARRAPKAHSGMG